MKTMIKGILRRHVTRPYNLLFHITYLTASFALILFLELWYSININGEWPSTLAYDSIFLASVTAVMAMSFIGPEDMRSRRQWRRFVWVMPLTCVVLGIAGYAITWWLYGNGLTPTVAIVAWSLLSIGTLIGLLIAWRKGRSFEWPETEKH